MPWNSKYWDLMDQVFWTLRFVGIEPVQKSTIERGNGMVAFPADQLHVGDTVYRRVRRAAEQSPYLNRQEEILNHVFDITYAIAPDDLIQQTLGVPMGFELGREVESLGREIETRYPFAQSTHFQQQDGFFVSPDAILAVEMKLKARSSPDQLLKYATLVAMEERHSGVRDQIGLLFLLPEIGQRHWEQCNIPGPGKGVASGIAGKGGSTFVQGYVEANGEAVRSVLDRLEIRAITWRELHASCLAYQSGLEPTNPGDQAITKLIDGWISELETHEDTGVHTVA